MFRTEIIGTLGADAEFKQVNNECYISLRVAHNDIVRTDTGERVEQTTWINVMYKSSSQKLLTLLVKGSRIFVRGFLSAHIYDSKQLRCKAIAYSIYATEFEICSLNNSSSSRKE